MHNPRYAGAFVYGRTRTGRTADLKPTTLNVPRENWQVLIQQSHPSYISWEEFEHNQIKLKNNAGCFSAEGRGGVPREGPALLQGKVMCGMCGNRMRVRYSHSRSSITSILVPYYICSESTIRDAGKCCQTVRGEHIDVAIGNILQEVVSPQAIQVALAVQQEIAGRVKQAEDLRLQQFERARYDAELARRRYIKVDPDNRLVAGSLEAEWNDKLRALNLLQQEHDQQRKADSRIFTQQSSKDIISLTQDFSRIWNDPQIPTLERKKIVDYLIEDVTLIKGEGQVTLHIRFKGGKTQSLSVPGPIPIARIRKTRPEVIELLEKLLDTCTDQQAAEELNKAGFTNWKKEEFTHKKVSSIRREYGLKSRCKQLQEQGYLKASELAKVLKVATNTIYIWGKAGLLEKQLYANNNRSLFRIPKDTTLEKRQGKCSPRPPNLTISQSS